MAELDLLELENPGEEFLRQHEAVERAMSASLQNNLNVNDQGSSAIAPGGGHSQRTGVDGSRSSTGADASLATGVTPDPTRMRRAVQSHFQDGASGERAKFTGDLARAPSFDLWERRYRALVKSLRLSESDKVSMLSEALADPALTFYYDTIAPDDARAGNSLPEAAASTPTNMAPNMATLSGALAAIEAHFCTDAARNVLKQELEQLKLSHVEMEENVSKPVALAKLKDRIRRLSCNGPREFRSETCMISALKKCLSGEVWAVDPIINANDRASKSPGDKTLEHYVQTLISYLREKETLTGGNSSGNKSSTAVPGLTHGVAHAYYGEARVSPRQTRTSYRGPPRQLPRRVKLPGTDTSYPRNPSGLPSGIDLRRMLAQPSQMTTGNSGTFPETRMRICWNCDKAGHLSRECPQPRRSRVDFARAMLVDHVPPMEVAVWMASEAEELHRLQSDTDEIGHAAHDDDDDVDEEDDEDPAQVFDTLLASMSRASHPRQDFC